MNPTPVSKNCQAFMNKIYQSRHWETIKGMLLQWRDQQKEIVPGMDTFKQIMRTLEAGENPDDKIIDSFNRCLVKDAQIVKKIADEYIDDQKGQDSQNNNQQALNSSQLSNQGPKKQPRQPLPAERTFLSKPLSQLEEIKEPFLQARIERHPQARMIIKIIHIYLKCVITLPEFKDLLTPLYESDPSLIHNLFQIAEDVRNKRRKVTIFAPLNELIDQKYPVEQVGPSYIIINEGYANYGKNWKTNEFEHLLNRKCVSVPLGSEVSFVIGKKNQFEEQLFLYEDQRYEIDITLQSLRGCEKLIRKYCTESVIAQGSSVQSKLASPMLQRVVSDLYPGFNLYSIFICHAALAKEVLLPRIVQKREELESIRVGFVKVCEEVASKNFKKSLDYRCIYFAKNDKKYNTPLRWDREIQMRKKQLLAEMRTPTTQEDIEDRESLTRHRQEYVNTFDHITNQNFMENSSVELTFDRHLDSQYPKFPDNQILFILNFKNQQILNDVLEIILYNCQKKNLLELLVFKIMKTDIKKKIKKSPLLLNILELKDKIQGNPEVADLLANPPDSRLAGFQRNNSNSSDQNNGLNPNPNEEALLNQSKSINNKNFKDSEDEFMQMIEEDEEPACLENLESPFEGPRDGYTFIGTKQIYTFMRYLLTIYQRFVKAKEESQQRSSTVFSNQGDSSQGKIDLYRFFLTILIYKIRDKNKSCFEEYLRKLYCEKAFIFFTLQKLITSAAKAINNISPESLTYSILKDQTKDYELGIFDWQKFPFPTVTNQLSRLYRERQMLYRFTFSKTDGNIFISAWNPPFKQYLDQQRNSEINELVEEVKRFINACYLIKSPSPQIAGLKFDKKLSPKNKSSKTHKREQTQAPKMLKDNKTEQYIFEDYSTPLIMRGQECLVRSNRPARVLDPTEEYLSQARKIYKLNKWI